MELLTVAGGDVKRRGLVVRKPELLWHVEIFEPGERDLVEIGGVHLERGYGHHGPEEANVDGRRESKG